jgi:hypothetical protein
MKNFILLAALAVPAVAQTAGRDLPTVNFAGQPVSGPQTAKVTLSFKGIPSAAAADMQQTARRLFAATSSLEQLDNVKLVSTLSGGKHRFNGVADPSAFVEINSTTGDISFSKGFGGYDAEGDTPNLPVGPDAVRRALKHLGDLDLLPGNPDEVVVEHVGGLRMGAIDEQGSTREYDKLTTVHFGRRLGGIPVGGPGSKITVQLGKGGELVGLHRRWNELTPVRHAAGDFVKLEEASGRVSEQLASEWNRAENIQAGRPEFGFFDDGKGTVEPAWFTQATLNYDAELHTFAKDGEAAPTALCVTPALRVSKADFAQQDRADAQPTRAKDAEKVQSTDDD